MPEQPLALRDQPSLEEIVSQDAQVIADRIRQAASQPFDLMVCSPRYSNAFSYHLYQMTRMVWLGMDEKRFKRQEIGSHPKYSAKGTNGATGPIHRWPQDLHGTGEAGFRHVPRSQRLRADLQKGAESVVLLANRAIGSLKQCLLGTHHGIGRGRLQAYLDEFVLRRNQHQAADGGIPDLARSPDRA